MEALSPPASSHRMIEHDPTPALVAAELSHMEPILHRAEYVGSTREHLAELLHPNFFEIASTGVLSSRDEVLDSMTAFHASTHEPDTVEDLDAVEAAADMWIVRYRLIQSDRITRRSTLWTRRNDQWVAVFHQGTIINDPT